MSRSINRVDRVLFLIERLDVGLPPKGVTLPAVQEKYLPGSVAPPVPLNRMFTCCQLKQLPRLKKIAVLGCDLSPEGITKQFKTFATRPPGGHQGRPVQIQAQEFGDQCFHSFFIFCRYRSVSVWIKKI